MAAVVWHVTTVSGIVSTSFNGAFSCSPIIPEDLRRVGSDPLQYFCGLLSSGASTPSPCNAQCTFLDVERLHAGEPVEVHVAGRW